MWDRLRQICDCRPLACAAGCFVLGVVAGNCTSVPWAICAAAFSLLAGLALLVRRRPLALGAAFALGLVVCFFVHVAEHEHFQAYVVLYDYGQETIGTLAEIEIAELHGEVELGDERDLFLLLRGLEGSVTAARARGARPGLP